MSASEFLANLVVPLNLSITLLLIALMLLIARWRKAAVGLAIISLAWSAVWSLPATSLWAGGLLEQRYPHQPPEALPTAAAIVVLGGNTANGRENWFEPYDSKATIPRTDTAAQLYLAGRAPLVVVSGAALDGGVSEARMMASRLARDGIPNDAILKENDSLTTHQNAIYTTRLLERHHIHEFLLVTSALHMPRAMASFQKQGLAPIAAPSPPQIVAPEHADFAFWLPNMRVLVASRSIIKEYLGLLVYWLRGWA